MAQGRHQLDSRTYRFFVALLVLASAMFGFVLLFYLGTALMRSILQSPEAAKTFLLHPWGPAGEGEIMWALAMGVVGAALFAFICQRILVRYRIMSQSHADDMWKEG